MFGIIVVCILIVALLVVIVMVYVFNVNVPGLRGKTLWDWFQLLIIPLGLAIIALVFQLANARTERQIAKERYEQDQQIALDKQREDLLQAYLDRMSELLLKEKLRSSDVDDEVRNVARVRTITILFQLDARRIGYVFAFLREAGLMSAKSDESIVSLRQANFDKINLSDADLREANLRGANLNEVNLSGAILHDADQRNTQIHMGALPDFLNSIETDLSDAMLFRANLTGTTVTEEQLAKAKSLKGATMPDGTKHE